MVYGFEGKAKYIQEVQRMRESGQNAVLKITQNDLIDELVDDYSGIYDRETVVPCLAHAKK